MIFGVMSNELSTPKVLICPAEWDNRTVSSTFSYTIPPNSANTTPYTNDYNVSYFVGVDAQDTFPQMFLTGDHNLGTATRRLPLSAIMVDRRTGAILGTNFQTGNLGVGWMDNTHSKQGNVGLQT